MPLVNGQLTDFGLDPLATNSPVLYFKPSSTGIAGINLLSARKAVEVVPADNGFFEVDLVATAAVAPADTHYIIELRYRDDNTGMMVSEVLPWRLFVPSEGGAIGDLLRVPANPALVFTGTEPPELATDGLWWLDPETGDLKEFDGSGWQHKANLRGPQGLNATDAAGDDAAIAAFIASAGTATSTELSSRFAPASLTPVIESLVKRVKDTAPAKSRPRIILMGDSITDQTSLLGGAVDPGGAAATVRRFDMIGYYTWAQMSLNHAIVCQREAGITGQSTSSMLARFAADVENVAGEFLILFGGINDIGSDLNTAEDIFGRLQQMAERAVASGKRVILCTLLRNEWDGTNGKADKRPKLHAINDYIRTYCKQQVDVYLCDWRDAVIDPVTDQWLPGMYFDTTHPNPVGASYMGKVLADVIRPLIVAADTDAISSNTDARNISKNPLMSGTAGVRGAGTGLIADSYNGTQGQTGGGAPFTGTMDWAKVARTSGGAWQQVKLTSAGGAWLYNRIQASTLGAEGSGLVEQNGAGQWQFKPGLTIRADIEWERDSDWNGVTLLKGGLHYEGNGNTGYAEDNANANITPTPTPAQFPMSGMLRTPVMTVPTGVTAILIDVRFSATAGTLRVGRMGSIVVGTAPAPAKYALGVEDYSSRYLAEVIRANETVTTWKDAGTAANDLTRDAGSAAGATIQALTESGKRFVRLRSTGGDVSLSDNGAHVGMVTLAAMVRLDALTSTDLMSFAKFNGTRAVRLHATGSRLYSQSTDAGFISGGGMPGWAYICIDVQAPSWRIDGSPYTAVSGTFTRTDNLNELILQALYTENAVTAERSVDVREAVIYDRALTTTEKTTVRSSMLAHYA